MVFGDDGSFHSKGSTENLAANTTARAIYSTCERFYFHNGRIQSYMLFLLWHNNNDVSYALAYVMEPMHSGHPTTLTRT